MNPLIQLKKPTSLILMAFLLASFGILPGAQAVVPAPDGGYPGLNTAEGQNALLGLTTGQGNTAVGWLALRSDIIGSFNTATGAGTLLFNTADRNTASGGAALLSNTVGVDNTGNGAFALFHNTEGAANTATGSAALFSNTTGHDNTAIGHSALGSNIDGVSNTAIGANALLFNTGNENIALGFGSGTLVTTANSVICIGAFVTGLNVSNTTWIGNVYGVTTQSGTTAPVIVSNTGQLGTVASSERFKKDIATMEKASEAILSLRPVTFHYRTDTTNTPQFGLVAEEVAKVSPALVLPDKEGKPYSVRYDQVNAMLLNEFLKEHKRVEQTIAQLKSEATKQEAATIELKSTVAQQEKAMEILTAQLHEQAAQIQTVRAQPAAASPSQRRLQLNKFATGRTRGGGPAPQTILNNP